VDPAQLLDRLWAEGAAIDDRQAIAIAREAGGPTADELALWASWITADDGHVVGADEAVIDRVSGDPACALLVLAIELRTAVSRRDHETIDQALQAIDRMIGATPRDERGSTAHAAADLALAETALYGQDLPAARRCLDALVVTGPTAIRITALMRMASLAVAGSDTRNAQKRARQALTLARSTQRTAQGNQAQLLLGLLSYMNDDPDGMRSALEPLVANEPNSSLTRFLLAGLEGKERSIELYGEGLAAAARTGDAFGYALCGLVGSRQYVALGKRADALLVMSMVRVQLANIAPNLVAILDGELETWREQWGDEEFAQAERDAIALLPPASSSS
jgi:hypothetical protein